MKKTAKKALALFLGASLLTSLTACGQKEASSKSEESSTSASETSASASESSKAEELVPEEGASLKLWYDNDDYNEKIVEIWNKKYPNVELTVEKVGTTDARAKLETDGPAGQGADVLIVPHDHVSVAAESGLFLEMDKFTDEIKEKFKKNAVDAVTYKGKIYAFPFSVKTIALFYNKALVSEPVKTWDEMREFAKSYNDPKNNKFALLWQATDAYFAHGFLAGYGYQIFGENHDDKTKINWDTPEALKGMEFYSTLRDIYPVASQDATWDAMNSMFSAGQAPYVITGPWSIKDFEKSGVDFGVVELPTLPNGNHPITFSTVDTVCVSSFTKYPIASMLLAQMIAENEDALKLLYDTKNELPASNEASGYDFIKNDKYLPAVAKQFDYSIPMPYIPEMSNVWTPYAKAFVAVWDKVQTPEEALKAAMDEFNSSLNSTLK